MSLARKHLFITERIKTFHCSCSRSKHDKHRLRVVSHFYCSQSTTNNDQFRVNTQVLRLTSSCKHRDGHKEQNSTQPETRIMKAKENFEQFSKRSTDSFYQSFRSLFENHLKVHSVRYMFLRKRSSCEYRHCRCLTRIAIPLNQPSVFGQIQHTNFPEHLCRLNKLLQLVPVQVLT